MKKFTLKQIEKAEKEGRTQLKLPNGKGTIDLYTKEASAKMQNLSQQEIKRIVSERIKKQAEQKSKEMMAGIADFSESKSRLREV